MSLSILIRSLTTFVLFSNISFAQNISKCPTQEVSYTATDASLWAICPNADYQAPSGQILNSIKSNTACAQLCQQYQNGGCLKAVYDKTNFICHLKGNGTVPWVSSSYYDSIRFVSKPSQGSTVTACPNNERNVTTSDGAQWAICPLTDYEGNTLQAIYQVSSESACATSCGKSNGCTRAVYDPKNLACFLKDGTQNRWAFNSAYETIRLVSKAPQQGDPVASCPSGDRNTTSQSGRGWAICNNTDFGGPASQITNGVTSAFNCMQQCDQTKGCTKAVWDQKNSICFFKDSGAAWAYNGDYQSIRLVNGTSSFTGNRGKWAPVVNLPVVPAGAFVVPEQPFSNRILSYSSWGTYEFSGATGITQFADYNWKTGAVSQRTVTETKHDMFCPGMSFLANGTMVVTGGENAEAVSFYNYKTNSWTRAADMKIARGYQSSTTLSNGKIFTIGGSFTGGIGGQDVALKAGEVYDPATNAWTLLQGCDVKPMLTTYDAEGPWRTDNHAWLYGWKNGYVFQAGPSKTMHWYGTTSSQGSVSVAGTRDADNDAMCGVHVMFDAVAGKIFSAGGSQSYTNSAAFTKAHQITITEPNQPAQVELLPEMNFQRGFANVVVLPNGQILITGGQATSLVFTDVQSVFAPELWDPVTKNFTVLAPATIPRNYHSVSLLLADGTVWAAGSGLCPVGQGESTAFCDQTVQHFNGEIFSPPYLFNSDGTPVSKPTISALSSNTDTQGFKVRVGGTLTIDIMNADASGMTFSLVRIGSATHSVNTDQRRVPLTTITKVSNTRYSIALPKDSGILIPGYWYLFAMNKAGTPAMARTIQVTL